MNNDILNKLRSDLLTLKSDWEALLKEDALTSDPKFLKKMASDIQKLDANASIALSTSKLKEQGEVIHFALSSPWGAPFIGETTLIDAARNWKDGTSDSALEHLLTGFLQYGHQKKVPLFSVLDEITDELNILKEGN